MVNGPVRPPTFEESLAAGQVAVAPTTGPLARRTFRELLERGQVTTTPPEGAAARDQPFVSSQGFVLPITDVRRSAQEISQRIAVTRDPRERQALEELRRIKSAEQRGFGIAAPTPREVAAPRGIAAPTPLGFVEGPQLVTTADPEIIAETIRQARPELSEQVVQQLTQQQLRVVQAQAVAGRPVGRAPLSEQQIAVTRLRRDIGTFNVRFAGRPLTAQARALVRKIQRQQAALGLPVSQVPEVQREREVPSPLEFLARAAPRAPVVPRAVPRGPVTQAELREAAFEAQLPFQRIGEQVRRTIGAEIPAGFAAESIFLAPRGIAAGAALLGRTVEVGLERAGGRFGPFIPEFQFETTLRPAGREGITIRLERPSLIRAAGFLAELAAFPTALKAARAADITVPSATRFIRAQPRGIRFTGAFEEGAIIGRGPTTPFGPPEPLPIIAIERIPIRPTVARDIVRPRPGETITAAARRTLLEQELAGRRPGQVLLRPDFRPRRFTKLESKTIREMRAGRGTTIQLVREVTKSQQRQDTIARQRLVSAAEKRLRRVRAEEAIVVPREAVLPVTTFGTLARRRARVVEIEQEIFRTPAEVQRIFFAERISPLVVSDVRAARRVISAPVSVARVTPAFREVPAVRIRARVAEREIPAIAEIARVREVPVSVAGFAVAQRVRPIEAEREIQRFRRFLRQPIPRVRPRIRRQRVIRFPILRERRPARERLRSLFGIPRRRVVTEQLPLQAEFQAVIRREGRLLAVGPAGVFGRAFRAGAVAVTGRGLEERALARTFFVRPTGRLIRRRPVALPAFAKEFRRPFGRTRLRPSAFVERIEFALDLPSEKREIQRARKAFGNTESLFRKILR